MIEYLGLTKFAKRNVLLFTLGINTNLRVSDMLTLRVGDVKGTHIEICEQKTKKYRLTLINDKLRKAIDEYIVGRGDNEYLFKSREGDNKPMTRQNVEIMLSDAARACGITYRVGCHSMRKTWGYHAWKYNGVHIAIIQQAYNHRDLETTKRYLGMTQDDLDEAFSYNVG
jgi:site-specific recombinase XerD